MTRTYRHVFGLLNYTSAHRPRSIFTIREHGRGMRRTTVEHWQMLRRLGRYLINNKTRLLSDGRGTERTASSMILLWASLECHAMTSATTATLSNTHGIPRARVHSDFLLMQSQRRGHRRKMEHQQIKPMWLHAWVRCRIVSTTKGRTKRHCGRHSNNTSDKHREDLGAGLLCQTDLASLFAASCFAFLLLAPSSHRLSERGFHPSE